MRLSKIKYLAMAPFLLLSLWVLSWGLADVFAYRAEVRERNWSVRGSVPEIKQWDNAKYWATLAARFNSSNPDYPEMLGRLYYWRFFVEDKPIQSLEEQNEYLNQGLVHFRSAIEKRPTWPQTWAHLLKLKSIADNLDEEYWYAWAKSQQLGRWENFVQKELLESGLQHWGSFTLDQQDQVLSVFTDMVSKPYTESSAFYMVDFYEMYGVICSLMKPASLENTKIMKKRCTALAAKEGSDEEGVDKESVDFLNLESFRK